MPVLLLTSLSLILQLLATGYTGWHAFQTRNRYVCLLTGVFILLTLQQMLILHRAWFVHDISAEITYVEILAILIAVGSSCLAASLSTLLQKLDKGYAAESYLLEVMNALSSPIISKDLDGTIRSWNAAAQSCYGYKASEVIGDNISILIPLRERTQFEDILRRVSCGEKLIRIETTRRRRSGEEFLAEITVSSVTRAGRVIGAVSICRDLSQENMQEKRTIEKHTLSAVGKLSGGVAHDFNNLIGGIQGYATMILEQCKNQTQVYRYAATIVRACQRAGNINKQLLAFSQQGKYVTVPIDIQAIMTESLAQFSQKCKHCIETEVHFAATDHFVMGDPAQIQNAVQNILQNAIEAMPHGGRLSVRSSLRQIDAQALPDVALDGGRYIAIDIEDTGVGIPREDLEQVFEPFFTTKPSAEGAGLGLAAAYGTIRNHHGLLQMDSQPGRGTTATILLPCLEVAEIEETKEAAQDIVTGHGRILLVDDDELVLATTTHFLQTLGYEVDAFRASTEALKAFEQAPHAYDILLSDMVMPAINGADLLRRVRAIRPEIPAIILTGFSKEIDATDVLAQGAYALVDKPFSGPYLSRLLRDALDQ